MRTTGPAPATKPPRPASVAAVLAAAAGRLADAWLPRSCALCDRTLQAAEPGLCEHCRSRLPGSARPRCPVCALGWDDPASPCRACAQAVPPFERTLTLADYAPPLDRLVLALKFGRELALARPLGRALAPILRAEPGLHDDPVTLVPVPLSHDRLAQRGFNQAEAIARAVARALRLPMRARWLARRRDTAAQSTLALAHRHANVADAFRAHPEVRGRRIVLVDDVMTSGATLQAAAGALKLSGARQVINLVAARTAP